MFVSSVSLSSVAALVQRFGVLVVVDAPSIQDTPIRLNSGVGSAMVV